MFKNDCYIIAEAGLNHNGSVEVAKKLIDVAAIAGVDAVKFQKRTVDKLAVGEVLNAEDSRFPEFGQTYREIREYLEFGKEEYLDIKKYALSKGLDFIVTAFDTDAVDFLSEIGLSAFKLASHSLTNLSLLEYISKKGVPVVMSTGMASIDEVDSAVKIFTDRGAELYLLHCVSAYPTPLDQCNLAMMDVMSARYNLPVGYSGHELGYLPTLLAVARGAQLIERHFTLDKNMVGFDHKISLEPDELVSMVKQIRNIPKIIGCGDKVVSESEWITRRKYHVSMTSLVNISKGVMLTEDMVTYKNPGTGIPPKNANLVLGKVAVNDIPADSLLTIDMFK